MATDHYICSMRCDFAERITGNSTTTYLEDKSGFECAVLSNISRLGKKTNFSASICLSSSSPWPKLGQQYSLAKPLYLTSLISKENGG